MSDSAALLCLDENSMPFGRWIQLHVSTKFFMLALAIHTHRERAETLDVASWARMGDTHLCLMADLF